MNVLIVPYKHFLIRQNINLKIFLFLFSFTFSKTSEDGLLGRLQATEAFLQQDDSTTIKVNNIAIPERPHNAKVTLTLTVSRDSPISKRSAQYQQGMMNVYFLLD